MNLLTIRRRLSLLRCAGSRRGIAAVEFALTLPIWMALFLGGMEMTIMMLQGERVDRISYTVTDIVTQSETLTRNDLNNTLLAAAQLMDPFPFGARGVVIISSLYKPAGAVAKMTWQHTGGGSLARGSKIGTPSSTSLNMPNGLVLNDNENVIVSEVYYAFEPLFINAGVLAAQDLYRVAVYKPRLSPLISVPQ